MPVYKLLGGYRDKVPAYASTMCGDDLPGGLDTPEAYARYAVDCKEQGYKSFKLHTWQPPIPGAPIPSAMWPPAPPCARLWARTWI